MSVVQSQGRAAELDTLQGRQGVWIRGEVAEAFVAAIPFPQVLSFRVRGQESPHLLTSHAYIGARGLFLEKGQPQGWRNFRPAQQPGAFTLIERFKARVEARIDDESQVQYLMEVQVDPRLPQIRLRYGYRNCAKTTRTLAGWSLTSFSREGRVIVPWAAEEQEIRSLTLFHGTPASDPSLELGLQALGFDLSPTKPSRGASLKVGLRSPAGWAAVQRKEALVIIRSPFNPDGLHPEGGSNITLFKSWSDDPTKNDAQWAEVEHVGAFQKVAPDHVLWMEETQDLLPPMASAVGSADSALESIKKIMAEKGVAHGS